MYDKDFWKRVEDDRNNGMSVTDVCKKYSIIPETLRRARYKGLLNDPRKLTAAEANQKRADISKNPTTVVNAFLESNHSLKRTIDVLGMSNSVQNRKLVQSILQKQGISTRTSSRIGELKYDYYSFVAACEVATNLTELAHNLGLTVHTVNNRKLKQLIQEYDVDIRHWGIHKSKRKYTYEEIFCENSRIPRTVLRHKILQFGALELTRCSSCGLSEWLEQPLKIQVDHINGNSRDNRIENLRALCPNCHSLTETYGGKNRTTKQCLSGVTGAHTPD